MVAVTHHLSRSVDSDNNVSSAKCKMCHHFYHHKNMLFNVSMSILIFLSASHPPMQDRVKGIFVTCNKCITSTNFETELCTPVFNLN